MVLLIMSLMISGCQKGTTKAKSYEADVNLENQVIKLENGVIVDFGLYNGIEDKFHMETSTEIDKENGGKRHIFELSLEKANEFEDFVTITIPYNPKETIPNDEENSVFIQYWDEEIEDWVLIDSDVNVEDQTISFYLHHFSKYCVVTVDKPGTPLAQIASISNLKMMNREKAQAIFDEYTELKSPGMMAMEEGLSILDNFVGYGGALMEMAAFEPAMSIFGSGVSATPFLQNLNKLAGRTGLSLAVVQLAFDVYRGDPRETTVNSVRNVITNYLTFAGTAAMKFSTLGVIAIDYSMNKFSHAAKAQYEKDIYRYVAHYNNEYNARSKEEWYKIIMDLYRKNSDNPEKINNAIQHEMMKYTQRFFDLSYDDQMFVVGDYGGKLPFISEEAKKNNTNRYMAELAEQLQPVFKRVQDNIMQEIKNEYFANLNQLRRQLNEVSEVSVKEEIKEGQASIYANHTLAFVKQSGDKINSDWTIKLDKNGSGQLSMSTIGYIQADYPQVIDIYDNVNQAPVKTIPFDLLIPKTEIVLQGAIPSFDEVVGVYDKGIRTITKVFVSDQLREEMNRPKEDNDSEGGIDLGIGCDLKEFVLGLEEQVNVPQEIEYFEIVKSSENTGTFLMDQLDFLVRYDDEGILNLEYIDEDEELRTFTGSLKATYAPDGKSIHLNGEMKSSVIFDPEDLLITFSISAQKE